MTGGEINSLEGLQIDFNTFRVFGYLDTTHVKTCRPGAGPVENGDRREDAYDLQRAFCLTYLKAHGLKVQSICLPNGM